MAKPKYDGVVQAVRYDDDGRVLWVRAFLRRGPAWSDYVLLDRDELIAQLNSGKRIVIGKRVKFLGGTFETSSPVALVEQNGHEFLVSGDALADRDYLQGVPLI
jgi:hypothetical protein